MARRFISAATVSLAAALAGPALGQKPAPPPSAASTTSSLVPKPDLVVMFEGNGPGLPTGFTVKNIGTADSKRSVLKVTATLVPAAAPSSGGGSACPPPMTPEQCDALLQIAGALLGGHAQGGSGGASTDNIAKACGNPFPELLEAVPVLKPGESKTFMRDAGPYQVSLTGVVSQTVSAQSTHVRPCSPTLVCAWDVKAVADASNDNDERNEQNNVSTRRAVREVTFK